MSKVSYGIAAPCVILNLGLFGIAALVIAILGYDFRIGRLMFPHKSFYFPAALLLAETALMIDYSVRGKFRHRDKMIRMIQWRATKGSGCRHRPRPPADRRGQASHYGRVIGTDIWS